MFEVKLPFAGFYCSIHESEIEREFEYIAECFADDTGRDIPESLMNLFYDSADHGAFHLDYAREYAESFLEWLGLNGQFVALDSPRFYNYGTDRVFVKIDRDSLARIVRGVDRKRFESTCRNMFTSRDGFISHYSAKWQEWGRLSEWDHNQLGALILAYAETEQNAEWDSFSEINLMESFTCNGGSNVLWQNDKAARAWKIYDYLRERGRRPVKTMKQWRVAFAKPFETTPLGSQM